MPRHLYGLHYSPWTERARWALDHHELGYRFHEHVPYLGEPLLRMRARRAGQTVASVPILFDGARALGDSMEIVFFADEAGGARPLAEDREEVLRWQRTLEPALQAGRTLVTGNVLADPDALAEAAEAASPRVWPASFARWRREAPGSWPRSTHAIYRRAQRPPRCSAQGSRRCGSECAGIGT